MLASGDPAPYDGYALVILGLAAVVLLAGAVMASSWTSVWAGYLRWGALLVSLAALGAVLVVTPTTNGIVGAGRMLTIWPAACGCVVFFLLWSWRVGHF
jgi:hypothetical protein